FMYAALTPVMGIIFFILAVVIWNVGVTKYRGAGN
ncbi:MAG: ABC transporter permease, partial [Bacillaceae bacterium]|nr:ABC transporter permease [Bacillaceae bacterium]